MKRKRSSVEQMVSVLKQAEVDVPVVEVCRQVGLPSRPSTAGKNSTWG